MLNLFVKFPVKNIPKKGFSGCDLLKIWGVVYYSADCGLDVILFFDSQNGPVD